MDRSTKQKINKETQTLNDTIDQFGFRKGRGTRDQIAGIHWIIEKARDPEKHLLLLH